MPPRSWGTLAVLAGMVLGALALRSYHLGTQSLWLDEAASWHFSSRTLTAALQAEPTNPPLYYTVLHFWIQCFGASEAAMRSLSILPSLGSILLVYVLAGRLFRNRPAALIAAGYQALSPFHLYYAQEARCFSLLVLLLLASTWFLVRAIEETGLRARMLFLAGYTITTALGLYTHFIATFFLATHAVYVLAVSKRDLRRIGVWTIAAGTSVLLSLPWLFRALNAASGPGQLRRHLLLKLPQTYFSFLFGDTLVPLDEAAVRSIAATIGSHWPALALAALALLATAPAVVAAMRVNRRSALLVLLMAAGPVAIAFCFSLRAPMLDERYLIGCSPFVYMALGAGIGGCLAQRRHRIRTGVGALILAVLVCVSIYRYFYNPRFGKDQWREAARLLDSDAAAGDLVVLEPDYLALPLAYYESRPHLTLRLDGRTRRKFLAGDTGTRVTVQGSRRVWLVRAFYPNDAVLNVLSKEFNVTRRTVFPKANGIEIYELHR